jgi:hypothetical protein
MKKYKILKCKNCKKDFKWFDLESETDICESCLYNQEFGVIPI